MDDLASLSSVDINYPNYAAILRRSHFNVSAVLVCDASGVVLWCDDEALEKMVQQTIVPRLSDGALTEAGSLRPAGGQQLCYAPIATENLGVVGYLVVLPTSGEGTQECVSPEVIEPLLLSVADCLQGELGMSMELNAMADELGERYEELNLVYDTDSSIAEQTAIYKSLRRLVESCTTFLELNFVSLLLPDKHIIINHHDDGEHSCMHTYLDDAVAEHFLEQAMGAQSGVVLNDPNTVLRETGSINGKVMLSPVVGGKADVIGVLVCVRSADGDDYSNSDRNLMDVVSRKVTQIIQTNYDSLTGLLNRAGYESKLAELLGASQHKGTVHTVLNIDLDDLQVINETSGYHAGDTLIALVTRIIIEQLRDTDVVARVGGDEFGVLLENCPLEAGVAVARKILEAIHDTVFVWNGHTTTISSTVGVTAITPESESVTSIISEVEVALEAAKDQGKNRMQIYKKEDAELTRRKEEMKWVGLIKEALEEDRFQLYSQLIVPIEAGEKAHHVEILLRMLDTEGKIIVPFSFIPAAEHYHLMPDIDRWVVQQTLARLAEHYRDESLPRASVAINLSGQSLGAEGFLEFVLRQVKQSGVPAEQICFEITESAAIANFDDALKFIGKVRALGCHFSLDDFGSGLSSFAYLKHLPVDYLKIDGAFVKDILDDKISEAMVTAINQVGQVMGLQTIAEYVENDEIRDFLQILGVDYVQGYGIGRPVPFDDYLEGLGG